ncbi:MAG: peptidylprolyl isomerase [Candidatus Omnitrophica bacterium]|nr:peptidylprolyl isomerase [Candidatus Omnitrophota bacterium]
MTFIKYGVIVLGIFGWLSGCGQRAEGSVLARFGGEKVTGSDLRHKVESLPRELKVIVAKRRKEFVEEMVNERFLYREAKRRHLDRDPEVKDLWEAAHRKILVAKLIELEVEKKMELGANEALGYYESHQEEFIAPLTLRASHILVKTEEEAREIKAKLEAGADFEELARTRSLDRTASRGGDLGFFQKGQLVPEFEEVALQLKKGELSDVFKTAFGYHVVKLTDRVEPRSRDFKAVRPLVERQLLGERRSRLLKDLLQKIRGNTKVTIDEKALESLSLASDK